jgi:hypothetical protein
MLMATVHLGTKNTDHQMRRYIFKRRADTSVNIIDLHKTWEKMLLAARVLVAIENPKVSSPRCPLASVASVPLFRSLDALVRPPHALLQPATHPPTHTHSLSLSCILVS